METKCISSVGGGFFSISQLLRVVIYAMVIPSVKLVALIVAEIWRDSEDWEKI